MDVFGWIGIAVLLLLVLGGVPLAVAFIIGSAIIAIFSMGVPLNALGQFAYAAVNSYPLLAAPFFILAGHLLVRSGGMDALRMLFQAFVGNITGGLPVAAIIFGAVLGAISGSAAACLAILATVMIPVFTSMKYERAFASGIIVTSAELGLIIPPSIFLILFGAFNRISITELFTAGMAAGILIAVFMAIVAVFISHRRGYASSEPVSWRQRREATFRALPLIGFPILVLGGIYGGFFSPTESASVAVIYALVLGIAVYRELDWVAFGEALIETAKITSVIYFLVIGADILSRMVGYLQVPALITDLVIDLDLGPLAFLFFVNAFLLVVGLFFSSLPMIITILPLFLPTVRALGIDPVLYGILGVINASIGEITPPFGPQLWLAEPICRVRMGAIIRQAWWFLLAWVAAVIVIILFPDIVMAPVHFMRLG